MLDIWIKAGTFSASTLLKITAKLVDVGRESPAVGSTSTTRPAPIASTSKPIESAVSIAAGIAAKLSAQANAQATTAVVTSETLKASSKLLFSLALSTSFLSRPIIALEWDVGVERWKASRSGVYI